MPLSPLDIKKKEFEQKMRGYDVDEVRAFLDTVSQEFELLLRDHYALEDELAASKKNLDHYLSLESTLERTLLAAQQTAVKMEEQAKKEASLILEETRLERDKVLRDLPLEIERARGEVIRLKAEYESTVVRMKALVSGFSVFIDSIAKAETVEL